MARVTRFTEIPTSGGGTIDFAELSSEYTRTFAVQTDVTTAGPKIILTHRKMPKIRSRHPEDRRAFVQSYSPERIDPRRWEVGVNYCSFREEEEEENPLERKVKIEFDAVAATRFTNIDIDGHAMRNTAGDQYGAQEINSTQWVISIAKNVAKVPKWVLDYDDNPINSDGVTLRGLTFPKRTLQLQGLRIPEATIENDVKFFALTFSLHYKKNEWDLVLLNEGMNERVKLASPIPQSNGPPRTHKTEHAKDDKGEKVAEPVLLDKNGARFRDKNGNIRTDLKDRDTVNNTYKIYKELPFGILPLK